MQCKMNLPLCTRDHKDIHALKIVQIFKILNSENDSFFMFIYISPRDVHNLKSKKTYILKSMVGKWTLLYFLSLLEKMVKEKGLSKIS